MKNIIINYMTDMLEMDKPDAEELLTMYVETLNEHCVKLKTAIDNADFDEIRRLTHSLTGCSGNVGAEYIVEIVRDINSAAKSSDQTAAKIALKKLLAQQSTLNE